MKKEIIKKYNDLVKELESDPNVLAFWLAGSRGKGMITKKSDYDISIIVKDSVANKYKKKYNHESHDSEIENNVKTIKELKEHAIFGSDLFWDRYNFAHIKVIFDKTKKIQRIIDDKNILSKKEAKQIIDGGLDAFINQVYRSTKCKRDGDLIGSHLEAAEAIPWFLNSVFALEQRVKPYYKYLKWELDSYPLKKFPWKKGELIKKLLKILKTGDEKTLLDLFKTTRPIFIKAGYKYIYDGWKNKYKVG